MHFVVLPLLVRVCPFFILFGIQNLIVCAEPAIYMQEKSTGLYSELRSLPEDGTHKELLYDNLHISHGSGS